MKRQIKSYSVQIIGTDVHVDIQSDRKKLHQYRIWADVRHPDVLEIARHLNAGLSHAQQNGINVEISEYFERMYVFITTPIKYHSNQYSAQEH